MKAGDLAWINYEDTEDRAFSYSGPGKFIRRIGESLLCNIGFHGKCLFPESSVRTIAAADEIKQRNKERK